MKNENETLSSSHQRDKGIISSREQARLSPVMTITCAYTTVTDGARLRAYGLLMMSSYSFDAGEYLY
jgi:hypothetical protein